MNTYFYFLLIFWLMQFSVFVLKSKPDETFFLTPRVLHITKNYFHLFSFHQKEAILKCDNAIDSWEAGEQF